MTDVKNVEQENNNTFSLVRQENGIAHLIMDVKGDTMNTLKAEFGEEVSEMLKEIRQDQTIKGIVLISGKADSFVAGADVHMLANCTSAAEATTLSRQGQIIFDQLENLSIPVVAAVHGACLGGGLELAMACHAIVCSDSPKTALGLPEVQLGLLPGGGGTQRLPKRVGIQKALDMMLTGKQLRAKQALKSGLVSDVVPHSVLIQTAEKLALSGKVKPKARKLSVMDKLLEGNGLGRSILFSKATKMVLNQTKGNYPAPLKIIDCIRASAEQAPSKGYQLEADHFGQLVMSDVSAQLRQLFFATTDMKKEQGVEGVSPEKITKAAVLGGGLMGGGIAFVTATKAKLPVRIKDISHQGISYALKYGYDLLNKKVKRRFMRHSEMQSQLALITGTTEYTGFGDVDIVVEAVFEDLTLKQNMVADIESHCKEETIFASNTSSLPIGQIAEKALRPENVIGLHYFSPVDKMPLAEIIAHEKTSDQTISTTVAFAKKQGKTPIVVKDKAGFYVNRILAPYMNEAAILLLEGCSIEALDKAMVKFGFPVGPMQLLDEVGIDVGSKIGPILQAELGDRFAPPAAFSKLIEDGRLGKKSKKGFYQYNTNSKKKLVDESVYTLLGLQVSNTNVTEAQVERCVYMMLNEAARCLDEGIVRNARDGDIGAIFGIGFPPFLGGPFQYMDKIGAVTIVSKLNQWQAEFGERFTPCDTLVKMAEQGERFYN
ncbi:fatty acid oxidation complex subunit alpha FadJ [Colwellia polaris]|jgi:3-hydroxyacyl-CoA dehydrogenase/enoyl-CoA hydratase/3-hydroxybutyryl-CoA epimerase|uniref:fatty acid oxidation complex subunit alpha FadJ n=1 Tax=Colwellia polaris TaxID=326537 RepID=UPI000A1766AA|nr:fatty acid oxidation complex subunit alpha FadJ [Colwellia polaris]|tara:strand:+ start:2994 stop:5144 length:2151 start_codon:yes stop_codon:yes gene_type:complete